MLSRRDWIQQTAAGTLAAGTILSSNDVAVAQKAVDPYADAKFIAGEPPVAAQGSYSIVLLPDTQNYSEKYPEQFLAQTEWVVANQQARKIACVIQLGDITNRNSIPEWKNAVAALDKLDGKVPYFLNLGNHDYSTGGSCTDRTTLFNDYFPLKKFQSLPTFGGVYDKEPERLENSYHTFSANGQDWVVLCLEFGPRNDVLRWANEVLTKHAKKTAIVSTHVFVHFEEARYDWVKYGNKQAWNPHTYPVAKNTKQDLNDGEEIWQKLITKHENVALVLNGHVLGDGLGRVVSQTPGGRTVNQHLVNFQMKPNGGDGWLRLLEIGADGKTVQAIDYSPTLKKCNVSEQNKFEFTI